MIVAGLLIVSYLLGTVPTALLVGRRLGFDPSRAGSRNPGASNAYRLGGRLAGAIVLAVDVAKGAAAAAAGLVAGGAGLAFAAGAAAVVGHVAPLTRPGHGGKGVATLLGAIAVVEPVAAAAGVVVWLAVGLATRVPALASLTMVVTFVATAAALGRPAWEVAVAGALAVVVAARHRGNLARLRAGGEARLPMRSATHVHES